MGVAAPGGAVNGWPSRVSEAQKASDLVERLPGRIVPGLAEEEVVAVVPHKDDIRVPAGNYETQQRERKRNAGGLRCG